MCDMPLLEIAVQGLALAVLRHQSRTVTARAALTLHSETLVLPADSCGKDSSNPALILLGTSRDQSRASTRLDPAQKLKNCC